MQRRTLYSGPNRFGETRIVETTSLTPNATAAGAISTLSELRPTVLISAARLAGYQACFDEIRIDRVEVRWSPLYGAGAGGRICVYLDRDITDGTVASVDDAVAQQEKFFIPFSKGGTLVWTPREPADREFHPLNPGNVSLARIHYLGAGLTKADATDVANGQDVGTVLFTLHATLRGRP